MGYLIIEEDLRYGYGVGDYLFDLGSNISFLDGHYLKLQLAKPLQFEIDCPQDEHPGHYFDSAIPVLSKAMIDVLK